MLPGYGCNLLSCKKINAMKNLLTLLLFLAVTSLGKAQDTTQIKQGAFLISQAMMKGDIQTILDYTYPKVFALGGGKEKLTEQIQKMIKELADQGISFRSIEIGQVSKMVKAGNELHCVIPHTLSLTVKGGYMTAESCLIGISGDQGKTWKYISAGNISEDKLKLVLPNFNPELKVPKQTPPVFHEEKKPVSAN